MPKDTAWGIKLKTSGMKRSLWVSPRNVTSRRVHASMFTTKEDAEQAIAKIMAHPENAHLTCTPAQF